VGDETVNGVAATHVKFSYDADKMMNAMMSQMGQTPTVPLPKMGTATQELWIDKSNNYPVKAISTGKIDMGAGSVETKSTQTFSKFNEPINPPIEKPANVTEGPAVPSVTIPTIEIPTIVIPSIEIPTISP
jgi:hypothetical protein